MRSHGLLLAAALALSDVISLAQGSPKKQETEAGVASKGSGNKPPVGKTDANDCFTIHLNSTGRTGNTDVNLDSNAALTPAGMDPPSYVYPTFVPPGTKSDSVIFEQTSEGFLIVAGTQGPVIMIEHTDTGTKGLTGLFMGPLADVINPLATVKANVGKVGGFQVEGGLNLACRSRHTIWSLALQRTKALPYLCLPATVTANKADCPKATKPKA